LHKYKNFDLLIINEAELRNEFKDRSSNLEELVKKLSKDYLIKKCIVTRGSQGALLYDYKSKHIISCPAFASKIVDKVGAGDAMLSLAALLLSNHLPDDLVLILSSLAGAQSVENLSNSKNINKINLLKHISHLLK
jgi:sugar/nucleoside kinase (ribokinase family)